MITASINLDKIDKSRIIEGKKGKYLNIALFETPNSEYGDTHMIVQSVSKEEREKGVRGEILGNAKSYGESSGGSSSPASSGGGDGLPF